MSKKDYAMIAETIKGLALSPEDKSLLVRTLCLVFKTDNKRFDVRRFQDACWDGGSL